MIYTVTGLDGYDSKRNKVTLDFGEAAFLLYKGECSRLNIHEGAGLDEDKYKYIMDSVLLPRAKKRALYYIKNSDKTGYEIRRKLEEGFYPEEVIADTEEFLKRYGFADDLRYAENYIESKKHALSRREIKARLSAKGIGREVMDEALAAAADDDEYEACINALRKKYPAGLNRNDMRRAYAFLSGRGFGMDTAERAVRETAANSVLM